MKRTLEHLPKEKRDELEIIVDARYKITKKQLEQLAARVKKLLELTDENL